MRLMVLGSVLFFYADTLIYIKNILRHVRSSYTDPPHYMDVCQQDNSGLSILYPCSLSIVA